MRRYILRALNISGLTLLTRLISLFSKLPFFEDANASDQIFCRRQRVSLRRFCETGNERVGAERHLKIRVMQLYYYFGDLGEWRLFSCCVGLERCEELVKHLIAETDCFAMGGLLGRSTWITPLWLKTADNASRLIRNVCGFPSLTRPFSLLILPFASHHGRRSLLQSIVNSVVKSVPYLLFNAQRLPLGQCYHAEWRAD